MEPRDTAEPRHVLTFQFTRPLIMSATRYAGPRDGAETATETEIDACVRFRGGPVAGQIKYMVDGVLMATRNSATRR